MLLDPDLLNLPSLRDALACRDITRVYQILKREGVTQREIADATGQSQSEVSEILSGRRVMGYELLLRISNGLGIPRGMLGLAYAEGLLPTMPPQEQTEVDEDMKRRALLAAASIALLGSPVLGELLELPHPNTPTPLPASLSAGDVAAVRQLTGTLEALARQFGGYSEMLTPAAQRAERLLEIPGAEATKQDLIVALGELHTVAGWAAFDVNQDDTARYHFARAMSLGGDADDAYVFAKAAYLAGVATTERGHFNDGLKMLQLASLRLASAPDDSRSTELACWLGVDTAAALARMNHPAAALSALSASRERWVAPDADDAADMNWVTGLTEMHLGRTEVAHALVTSSVQYWEGTTDNRQAVLGNITLAALSVQAGEPRGVHLAEQAIESTAQLRSVRARVRLRSLVDALETRSRPEHVELVHRARQVTSARV